MKPYLDCYWGSVKELIRIAIRNDWVKKEDLIRLIETEYKLKGDDES